MSATLFDQLDATLKAEGAGPAIDRLCQALRSSKDYNSLFYALLMKKRQELGVNPIPTGPASELPERVHQAYESAIRDTAREIGALHLAEGNIPQSWVFFRMIEEPAPVREAIEKYEPNEDDDLQPLVQIAFYEGVHPRKGFDWVLSRYGICSAITTASGELPHGEEDKLYFVRSLVRALYNELRHRLATDIERHGAPLPPETNAPPDTPGVVKALVTGSDFLFDEDNYHIDTSHLSSVVQMSMHLKPCLELTLAQELCEYGKRLKGRFVGEDIVPFDNGYADYQIYLTILAGENVEQGLAHFRRKAEEADPDEIGTYPAEVLVNLLLKLGRGPEAVAVAQKYLRKSEGRQLTCPNLNELCQRFKIYDVLAEVAKDHDDPVHYLAGRIASQT